MATRPVDLVQVLLAPTQADQARALALALAQEWAWEDQALHRRQHHQVMVRAEGPDPAAQVAGKHHKMDRMLVVDLALSWEVCQAALVVD